MVDKERLRRIMDTAAREWKAAFEEPSTTATTAPSSLLLEGRGRGIGGGSTGFLGTASAAVGGAPIATIHGVVYALYLFLLLRRVFQRRNATGVFLGDGSKELAALHSHEVGGAATRRAAAAATTATGEGTPSRGDQHPSSCC